MSGSITIKSCTSSAIGVENLHRLFFISNFAHDFFVKGVSIKRILIIFKFCIIRVWQNSTIVGWQRKMANPK
ncbi:hypothetical protein NIES21_04490 [Anabaenopsis circularis NIES-21]|uniref:Uncharacterized protein n=1 Tax=Anabaenopsis circularis NIES-21 TaxID=1085406 RepID=A0A1Z4GB02_9CYAN|nr:hypothetical protein NIES21_04490 [Anabaenopsis circularis NIES-21]